MHHDAPASPPEISPEELRMKSFRGKRGMEKGKGKGRNHETRPSCDIILNTDIRTYDVNGMKIVDDCG